LVKYSWYVSHKSADASEFATNGSANLPLSKGSILLEDKEVCAEIPAIIINQSSLFKGMEITTVLIVKISSSEPNLPLTEALSPI